MGHLSGPRSPQVVDAFARVPRERFVGPPPWLLSLRRRVWHSDELRDLYQDVLVSIDASRGLNNGQPSLLALLIDALDLRPGERAVHVGCATGYYSALIAELVGAAGSATAIEIDVKLAARARENLSAWPQARVMAGDGSAVDFGPADAILVNAGATHPAPPWLDRLEPGGRLVLPLTATDFRGGAVLRVERRATGFGARFISTIAIFPCAGARDPELDRRLGEAFRQGRDAGEVRSLRRDPHATDASCFFHGEEFCVSTRPPAG